jgi:hypothetical protein
VYRLDNCAASCFGLECGFSSSVPPIVADSVMSTTNSDPGRPQGDLRSELINWDSVDEVFRLGVALEPGDITSVSPVENVVAMLAWMVMAFVPPVDVMLMTGTTGVGAKLGDDDVDALVDDGGMIPESPVEKVTAVLEEVENPAKPTEIDMSMSRLGEGVTDTEM